MTLAGNVLLVYLIGKSNKSITHLNLIRNLKDNLVFAIYKLRKSVSTVLS